MGSKNPNFGKKLSEKTRKKMSVARKGGNDGSFKKGEHRSTTTEFKKGQDLLKWFVVCGVSYGHESDFDEKPSFSAISEIE